jgi:periplasmic protein TonB
VPRDMFGDVMNPTIKLGSQKWYTLPLSILAHVGIFAAIIIIPLMATDVLPTPPSMMAFVAAAPPPPPPPPPPPAPAAPQPKIQPVPVQNPNAAPIEAPKEIKPEPSTSVGEGVPGGVEGGVPGGVVGGVVGGLPEAPPPPPPPPQAPVRVGGNIKAPTKVRDVKPVYPPIAQSARVQGVVIIEATIGPDGRVKDAKVLRSIPLLDQAALDAVKQWVFTPTLLNGVPVPVIMTVTVNFTLQ